MVSHLGDFTSFLPALFTSFLEDFGGRTSLNDDFFREMGRVNEILMDGPYEPSIHCQSVGYTEVGGIFALFKCGQWS